MNYKELAQTLHVSESTIKTNFPKLCSSQLKKGIQITKLGTGDNAEYFIEKVTPKNVDKSELSSVIREVISENLPNEFWTDCYVNPKNFEVSNLGRFRNKKTKIQHKGTLLPSGYIKISIENKEYFLHRLVLGSFQPIENMKDMTVDHINGIRSDNCLTNLRWSTGEENIQFMINHRAKLNTELTKLINHYGYDETLKMLQQLTAGL